MKAKKEKSQKLKQVLKEMGLSDDDMIFIHQINKANNTDPIKVSDIPSALLKKDVYLIQPNHGGQKYGYKLFNFILS